MRSLDDRLRQVAACVAAGTTVADIGTDHAGLAIYLIENRQADEVIAADLNFEPCEAARRQIALHGLTDKICVRQGDGLSVLVPGEVQVVCMAGMGGELMQNILADAPHILTSLRQLVLQPMNDAQRLRRWLYGHGWHIEAESIASVRGIFYAIISAKPGGKSMPDRTELYVGPDLCAKRPLLFKPYVTDLLGKINRARNGMTKSVNAVQTEKYAELTALAQSLEELIR